MIHERVKQSICQVFNISGYLVITLLTILKFIEVKDAVLTILNIFSDCKVLFTQLIFSNIVMFRSSKMNYCLKI